MKIKFIASILILQICAGQLLFAQSRGVGVRVKNETTNKVEEVTLYKASFALVIGVSDYTNGWQSLPGVKTDAAAVTAALNEQGFQVTTILSPKKAELSAAIEKFINDYGYEYENRVLIYYAGHGNTQKSGAGFEQGFIVPSDAPAPKAGNEVEFLRSAISMDAIERYAQEINAKHALFIFDSCFSGSLISKTRSPVPPMITFKVAQPVRQFITAGTDEQEVPDISIFRQQFIEGIKGAGDRNADGFVTASELADYLQDNVSRYSRGAQTPQYGKIRDGRLDKGDFVFVSPKKPAVIDNGTAVTNPPPTVAIDPNAGEREAWNQIKESTNRSDYALFVESFPGGIYAAQARQKWEQIWWDAVKGTTRTADLNEFLQKFPTGQYAGAAKFALKRLETAANPPTTKPINSGGAVAAGTIISNSLGMKFAYSPAGTFQMGSNNGDADEKPVRLVSIGTGFYMGRTEVTQGQWEAVMGTTIRQQRDKGNPSWAIFGEGADYPMYYVSWEEAKEFVSRLNAKNDDLIYSLPTEAEWEYAARAGTTGDYAGDLDSMGWFVTNSDNKTHPVAQKQPNAFGLYDMHGNVYEWVEDIYNQDGYTGLPTNGSANMSVGDSNTRVLRGGSWHSFAGDTRSANRLRHAPSYRNLDLGFRVLSRSK